MARVVPVVAHRAELAEPIVEQTERLVPHGARKHQMQEAVCSGHQHGQSQAEARGIGTSGSGLEDGPQLRLAVLNQSVLNPRPSAAFCSV